VPTGQQHQKTKTINETLKGESKTTHFRDGGDPNHAWQEEKKGANRGITSREKNKKKKNPVEKIVSNVLKGHEQKGHGSSKKSKQNGQLGWKRNAETKRKRVQSEQRDRRKGLLKFLG